MDDIEKFERIYETIHGEKPRKYTREEMKNKGKGYIPHEGMSFVICPKCGHDVFTSYPQSVSLSSPTWTYEHVCVNCGHMIGITVKNWRNTNVQREEQENSRDDY